MCVNLRAERYNYRQKNFLLTLWQSFSNNGVRPSKLCKAVLEAVRMTQGKRYTYANFADGEREIFSCQ